HVDKTIVTPIKDITPQAEFVQVKGRLLHIEQIGDKRARRLTAVLSDGAGTLDLVWFQEIQWIQKSLVQGQTYLVHGRTGIFNGRLQISHPEIEPVKPDTAESRNFLEPVYPSTEKLRAKGLGGRQIAKLTHALFSIIGEK